MIERRKAREFPKINKARAQTRHYLKHSSHVALLHKVTSVWWCGSWVNGWNASVNECYELSSSSTPYPVPSFARLSSDQISKEMLKHSKEVTHNKSVLIIYDNAILKIKQLIHGWRECIAMCGKSEDESSKTEKGRKKGVKLQTWHNETL